LLYDCPDEFSISHVFVEWLQELEKRIFVADAACPIEDVTNQRLIGKCLWP